MHRRGIRSALVTLPFLLVAGPLFAQDMGPVVLRGQIVDATTYKPVAGAFVAPSDSRRGVVTDTLGVFVMRLFRADEYRLRVRQLGYRELHMAVTPESAEAPIRLMLTPDPVQIEGLTVLADQLADRRRGIYGVATVLDQKELSRGRYTSFYEMEQRLIPSARLCPDPTGSGQNGDELCFNHQGHTEKVAVCIDGRPALGQGAEADLLDPRRYYLVEAYPRVGQIRVYSQGYVARLAANGQKLPPLSFGCIGAMPGAPGGP